MPKGSRTKTRTKMPGDEVDWRGLEVEVVRKIRLLRAAWESSQRDAPPTVHQKMVKDIFLPCVRMLGVFCTSVQEEDA